MSSWKGEGSLLGIAMAVIFVAAGFHGTWQTGRVRMGILVATATSASGSLIVALYSPTPSSTESQVIKLLKKPMAKAKRRVQVHSLQVDYQGAAHHGTYVVERGILTVRSGLGSRSTELATTGTVNPLGLAKQFLRDLAKQKS